MVCDLYFNKAVKKRKKDTEKKRTAREMDKKNSNYFLPTSY